VVLFGPSSKAQIHFACAHEGSGSFPHGQTQNSQGCLQGRMD
jgi:hypothetical protein